VIILKVILILPIAVIYKLYCNKQLV